MDKIRIQGGTPLEGTVIVSGSKNAALPLMAASMLTAEDLTFTNLPHLADIATMANLLAHMGVSIELDGSRASKQGHLGEVIRLNAKEIKEFEAPYDIVRKMRASVYVLGPLLARYGRAQVSLPGGCAIGTRPIDLHLKAFEQMGAKVELEQGYVHAQVDGKLKGAEIEFEKISVGATENILMAATLAEGQTIIKNAAKEPEVTDLAHCLVKMGAKIEGIETDTLVIDGVEELHGCEYDIIPDRIEAGTYMIAAAITGGDITVKRMNPDHLKASIAKLKEAGAIIEETEDGIRVSQKGPIKSINAVTDPYPGFATDMQAQLMALMTLGDSESVISETIFENRFMHVPELARMGANISVSGCDATVKGVSKLKGAELMATDLRASVSLVLAALAAEGESVINRMYHLDRGYERLEEKLKGCGAIIERVSE